MKNFILYSLLAAVLCVSCSKNDIPEPEPAGGTAVEFSSYVTGTPFHAGNHGYTRAYDTSWSEGDEVGIFMFKRGELVTQGSILENRKYTVDAQGNFRADAENMIILTETDPEVDFIAYYPYDPNAAGYFFHNTILDQEDQEALDFLYAKTDVGYTADNMPVELVFSHGMTKLVFNVTADAPITSFKALLQGAGYDATFALDQGYLLSRAIGEDIVLKSTVNGQTVTVEGMVYPEGLIMGSHKVVFTVNGREATWMVPLYTMWQPGQKHMYNVKITGLGMEVEENYGWFETPVRTNIENTVFLTYELPEPERAATMRNYSMLYDTKYKIAYWVAYPMHQYYREGSSTETNYNGTYWFYDTFASHGLTENMQPNVISAWPNPQAGIMWDRGHQIPSADRRYSLEVNKSTYYVTNQTAQQKDMNQGIWAALEGKVRTWMNQNDCDTLYVVTGAHLTTETDKNINYVLDNSGRQIALPKYYYKALAKVKFNSNDEIESCHTIGFKMDNANISGTWDQYSLKVSELEEMTGFTFFPSLPDDVKNTVTPSRWQ